MGGGGGCAKVHILLHLLYLCILVCAAFFDFSVLIFFEKISLLSGVVVGWLWCYLFMAGVHCFADIDQADLLGGGGELLG